MTPPGPGAGGEEGVPGGMGIEAIIARTLQVLLALGGAYLAALWFVLVVWTYRDIEARSRNVVTQVFSTLLVVLFWIPGVFLYMILRPKETLDGAYQRSLEEEYLLQDLEELPLCPSCERFVVDDFVLCPHCHTRLRDACLACERLIDLRWSICPYCGEAQGGESAGKPARVEAPAARWRAPSRRRVVADPAVAASEVQRRESAAPAAIHLPSETAAVEAGEEWSPAPESGRMVALTRVDAPSPLIPLVPVPRGRFRRVAAESSVNNGHDGDRRTTDDEPVPTNTLMTSMLGKRASEPDRFDAYGLRARRAARQHERAGFGSAPSANGNGAHESSAAEPKPIRVNAEGKGD